jgi:hypothetical protein
MPRAAAEGAQLTRQLPSGYQSPTDPARDQGQVMRDAVAQRLIAELIGLHEHLTDQLDHAVYLAALGPGENAGPITGTGEQDQMMVRADQIQREISEWKQLRKNALEELRRARKWYRERLGLQPLPADKPRRTRVESIDYRNDGGERRVG